MTNHDQAVNSLLWTLKAVRVGKGMTQADVSQRLGVSTAWVSIVEAGRHVSAHQLVRYAHGVGAAIYCEELPDV